MKRITFVLVFIFLLTKLLFAAEPLFIGKVSISPKTIDVSRQEKATLQFEISRDAFVTILLKDENGNQVNRFELGMKKKGKQTFVWDGKTEKGESVTTDVVIYSINAQTEDKQITTYDPSRETGGADLKFPKFSFDKEKGKVEYVLPQAARVRLRAGLTEGVLLNTLFDWESGEAGRHEFIWDGKDKSGEMNLLKHPNLNMNLNAFSLPDNSIIVKGIKPSYLPPNPIDREQKEEKHFHYSHPRMLCHEPHFKIVLLKTLSKDEKDVPTVKGKVPVSIVLDPKDEQDLIRKRFEVMVYLDTEFLFEEEQGISPATFFVDLTSVSAGDHLLTVNLMSYDDHVGVETMKVKVIP